MTMEEAEKIIEDYKTPCCKAKFYRAGRAKYLCKNCEKDITMDLIYLYDAMKDSEEIKPTTNE